ncbi:MAG TPA: hypothetical protein ENH23_00165, partial [candidate division Zixibacteria bacterium]|nr:hypothetical protein [candidate division Zixibacteria bacterium]
YVYLNGQPLAKIENNSIYFYHNDHLGTPMMMTDGAGQTVWQGEYLPFGEEYSITGSITNNLRFPGQYYDEETGLHYNYFRDYNPVIGRYVESDPIGIKQGMNHLYLYVGNNPVNFADAYGLFIVNDPLIYYDAINYAKCIFNCMKKDPRYKDYKRDKFKCLNAFMACASSTGGNPILMSFCYSIKKICDGKAYIQLIPITIKCAAECARPPCTSK